MSETTQIPEEFTINGHEWQYYTYDGGNRYQWFRSFTDAEVDEKSRRFNNVSEVHDHDEYFVACPVFDDPSYLIELHHVPSSDRYTVTASETSLRDGITNPISTEYRVETDDRAEAISTVTDFARALS